MNTKSIDTDEPIEKKTFRKSSSLPTFDTQAPHATGFDLYATFNKPENEKGARSFTASRLCDLIK